MSENPYKSADSALPVSSLTRRFSGRVILGLVALFLLTALFLWPQREGREAATRTVCTNNVKQILLALHRYHDDHGTFPPAYTVDEQGNPLHSWRTLLLPYLEQQQLYEQIDLTRPWDDPVNTLARQTKVQTYLCPMSPHEEDITSYLALTTADGPFSGLAGKRLPSEEGDLGDLVAIVDVSSRHAVHWMCPEDVSIETISGYASETRLNHGGRIICGMLDGSVEVIELRRGNERFEALFKSPPLPNK